MEEARSAFGRLRELFRDGRVVTAERELGALENVVCERFRELEEVAAAVADANVRSVEILEQQEQLRLELERQYRQICDQNEQIMSQQRDLEERAEALANANVEAVLLLDGTSEQLHTVSKLRDELKRSNLEMVNRTRELESEALALAEANALAVEMLDRREEHMSEVASKLVELRELNDDLHHKALVDGMTGLMNHRFFSEQIGFEVARAQRYGRELSLLFVDVDHFKQVNDTHGHCVGDAALRQVAALLRQHVRTSDLPLRAEGSPFAARYGGEEFVVILPETGLEGARVCAERLRSRVASASLPGGHTQPQGRLTISIGVATLREGDDAMNLVRRADQALYCAKRKGRNRVIEAGQCADGD